MNAFQTVSAVVAFAAWGALAAPLARAQSVPGLLPTRPEVQVDDMDGGQPRVSVRGQDCRALDVLSALMRDAGVAIVVDAPGEGLLRGTIVTVDMHQRPAEDVIALLCVAAGVDLTREVHVFRVEGPPRPGAETPRTSLWQTAERFYEHALSRLVDEEASARAQRGLAELNRLIGDYTTAYAHYEALLSRFPRSVAANGAEVALADCYVRAGEQATAQKLLKHFLDRCQDPHVLEQALRRLLRLLLDAGRLRDVEDLRSAFLRIGSLAPETVAALAAAGSVLVEKGYHQSAVLLMQELWSRDPARHAALGPVLALALVAQNDVQAATGVLQRACQDLDGAIASSAARLAFAEIAMRAGRTAEAIVFGHAVLTAEDREPSVELRAHLLLFNVYRDLGLVARARTHLYSAERLSTPQAAGELSLESARMALDAGQPVEARLLFQESLRYQDVVLPAELGIVRALMRSGEVGRALTVLRDMFTRNDLDNATYALARELAVEALEARGDFNGARRVLRGDLAPLTAGATSSGDDSVAAKDAP